MSFAGSGLMKDEQNLLPSCLLQAPHVAGPKCQHSDPKALSDTLLDTTGYWEQDTADGEDTSSSHSLKHF